MTVHSLGSEVGPGPVLCHHVREPSCQLDEEIEPSHIVHVIVLPLSVPHIAGPNLVTCYQRASPSTKGI